jgi:hypothetical protein
LFFFLFLSKLTHFFGRPRRVRFTALGDVELALPHIVVGSPSISCQPCQAGYWCSGQHMFQCPDKTLSPSISSSQTQCLCVAGYYSSWIMNNTREGSTPCAVCPKNYYCLGNGSSPLVCPDRMKSNPGSTECIWVNDTEVSSSGEVVECPVNSHTQGPSSNLSACKCNDGFYNILPSFIPVVCEPCPPDYFCNGGDVFSCNDLSISTPGSVSPSDCFCMRGYYGTQNNPCVSCPIGSWCWTGIRNTCPFNSWSRELSSYASDCTCTAGYFGPAGGPCIPCSSGTYKHSNSTTSDTYTACLECEIGTYSVDVGATSISVCLPCSPGSYNSFRGQTSCVLCDAGFYGSSYGMTTCKSCWAGSYSRVGASLCSSCSTGTVSAVVAAPSSSVCQPCPVGSWSAGNVSACTPCGACYYWSWPPRYMFYVQRPFSSVVTIGNNYRYRLCQYSKGVAVVEFRGMYNVDLVSGVVTDLQISFPGNGFSAITAHVNSPYIYAIQPPNLFRVNTLMGFWDLVYPASFPQGLLIDGSCLWVAQSDGIRCLDPVLTTSLRFFPIEGGATGICKKQNTSTDPFIYVTTMTQGLKKISIINGSVTTVTTQDSLISCRFTLDNRFVLLIQGTSSQLWAYSTLNGLISPIVTDVVVDDILLIDEITVLVAIDGQGIKNMTIDIKDSRDCSPGRYSLYSGLQRESQCSLCPIGRFCSGGANISDCAPGSYSFSTGLRDQAQCTVCEQGYYCIGGTYKTICPAGYYSLKVGLRSQDECLVCPKGYYCPNTTTLVKCPNNTMSAEKSADLVDCKCMPGFMCELVKVSHVELVMPISLQAFTAEMQRAYIQAIAAAAGVDPSKVSIISLSEITVAKGGNSRRMLGLFNTHLVNRNKPEPQHHVDVVVTHADAGPHMSDLGFHPTLVRHGDSVSIALDIHASVREIHQHSNGHDIPVPMNDLALHLQRHGLPVHLSVQTKIHHEIKRTESVKS